jgi:hypothetical protein
MRSFVVNMAPRMCVAGISVALTLLSGSWEKSAAGTSLFVVQYQAIVEDSKAVVEQEVVLPLAAARVEDFLRNYGSTGDVMRKVLDAAGASVTTVGDDGDSGSVYREDGKRSVFLSFLRHLECTRLNGAESICSGRNWRAEIVTLPLHEKFQFLLAVQGHPGRDVARIALRVSLKELGRNRSIMSVRAYFAGPESLVGALQAVWTEHLALLPVWVEDLAMTFAAASELVPQEERIKLLTRQNKMLISELRESGGMSSTFFRWNYTKAFVVLALLAGVCIGYYWCRLSRGWRG